MAGHPVPSLVTQAQAVLVSGRPHRTGETAGFFPDIGLLTRVSGSEPSGGGRTLGLHRLPCRLRALVASALPATDSRTKAGEQAGWLTGLEPATPRITIGDTVVLSRDRASLTANDSGRCTTRCTETAERLDELARAVALVASMPLADSDRRAVLARLIGGGTQRRHASRPAGGGGGVRNKSKRPS